MHPVQRALWVLAACSNTRNVAGDISNAWINEFHYNNAGADELEFVEVAVVGSTDSEASLLSVYLYNGATGAVYDSQPLDFQSIAQDDAVSLFTMQFSSIQNGVDGLALVCSGCSTDTANSEVVLEFLSYQGTFVAQDGPAQGQTSSLLPVTEDGSTTLGDSIQRIGSGCRSIDFGWSTSSMPSSTGARNADQTFECEGTGDSTVVNTTPTNNAWINEVHYNNESNDVGEMVEIMVQSTANLLGWQLLRYNGNNGSPYGDVLFLDSLPKTNSNAGFSVLVASFPANGLQNGPDGLVLVDGAGAVVEFLSYGGSFNATTGPAAGTQSVDIDVTENDFTSVGSSLQLRGTGCERESFSWELAAKPQTGGNVNILQCLDCGGPLVDCGSPAPQTCQMSDCIRIEQLQGSDTVTPFEARSVSLCPAYVTLIQADGFYIQHGTSKEIGEASSGVYVYTGDVHPIVMTDFNVGDLVQVCGNATEFGDLTEVLLGNLVVLPPNPSLPTPSHQKISLTSALEPYEGMLVDVVVEPEEVLVVSELFELDRFGRIVVCSAPKTDGRIFQYAQANKPDSQGYAEHLTRIRQKCLFVDDNLTIQNPVPPRVGGVIAVASPDDNIRAGNQVSVLRGVLFQLGFASSSYSYGVQPISLSDITIDESINTRPVAPTLTEGQFNVTSSNLLNYFTNFNGRGPDNELEFNRQRGKLLTAMSALNSDIFSVIEIENTRDAVENLLIGLNSRLPGRSYMAASLATDETKGSDEIRSDIFYDSTKFALRGVSTLDDSDQSAQDILQSTGTSAIFSGPGTSRVPIAATLEFLETKELVTLVAIHFKSKGGTITSGPNADRRDGAGRYNENRLHAAQALRLWLSKNPTGFSLSEHAVVLLGDFNAYAQEDPMRYLQEQGFSSVEPLADPAYSFVFSAQWGTLDYIMVSDSTVVEQHATWHINSDEPDLFDYQTEFREGPDGLPTNPFDPASPARFSDHDPLSASFNLSAFKRSGFGKSGCGRIQAWNRVLRFTLAATAFWAFYE